MAKKKKAAKKSAKKAVKRAKQPVKKAKQPAQKGKKATKKPIKWRNPPKEVIIKKKPAKKSTGKKKAANSRKNLGKRRASKSKTTPKPAAVKKAPVPRVKKPKVVLYGAVWCPYCNATKDFLKRNNIPFMNKDIEKTRGAQEEMIAKSGQTGIPQIYVTDLKGKEHFIYGYDVERLKQLLGIQEEENAVGYG